MHICMCLETLIIDNYQYFLVKAMVFPVVMYGCESWTVKKAEKLMFLNYGVGEESSESLGLQGDTTSSS